MTGRLTSDAELAEQWGIDLDKFHALRKRHGWPHVKLGRFEFRFTDEQIARIIASETVTPSQAPASESGLTPRSARQSA